MTDNVVSLVKKEETKGYIEIKWTSGEIEIVQADSFGPYEDLKGYIIVFKDPDEVVGLFNSDTISYIKVLKDYKEDIYNKYRVEYYDYEKDEIDYVNVVARSTREAESNFFKEYDSVNTAIRFIKELD